MNTQHNNKNMSIRELRGRMQRAKKRAIKRAKRYYIGKNPPFKRGIIDGEFVSTYRMLLKYANEIQIDWDNVIDDNHLFVNRNKKYQKTLHLLFFC